eukprot:36938-Eustigmatos_ZCMA.PRE.1
MLKRDGSAWGQNTTHKRPAMLPRCQLLLRSSLSPTIRQLQASRTNPRMRVCLILARGVRHRRKRVVAEVPSKEEEHQVPMPAMQVSAE